MSTNFSSETRDVNSPSKWERDYQRGEAGWDIGTPTPVFQRLIRSGEFPPGRILVPCAGRGHDAREFARHGFEVVAVDFARDAVEAMRALMDDVALSGNATRHEIWQGDLFQLPQEWNSTFDYVLEYTCYCAIDPKRREEYADMIARVLKKGGKYIALALPLNERVGGPPFTVKPDELIAQLTRRGLKLLHREFPPDSIKPRKGNEELLVLEKA
ncbi:MAG: methyltransferase domain-containing protein [Chloroflexota bacterium]|nr:MAG: methyltransferase domain-containing protein [Chloroflexota bacterium]